MREFLLRAAAALLVLVLVPAAALARCRPDALGVSRAIGVGALGAIGLKSYPRTLDLADKELVLTFDDGPLPGPTTRVLDALAAECVKATFFVIGRNAAANPHLVRRQIAEGHTVANHTFSHPAVTMRGLSDAAARADIERGAAAIAAAGGGRAPFFRFPGFADTPALVDWLGGRGVTVFGTDLWASDWTPMSPQAQLALVLGRIERARKGVVLFHDTREQTAAMLPALLRELKARGYRIAHVAPGGGAGTTRAAPGWRSETERLIAGLRRGAR